MKFPKKLILTLCFFLFIGISTLFVCVSAASVSEEKVLVLPESIPLPNEARLVPAGENGIFLAAFSEGESSLFLLDGSGEILQSANIAVSDPCADVFFSNDELHLVFPTFADADRTRYFTRVLSYRIENGVFRPSSTVQLKSVYCEGPGTLVLSETGSARFYTLSWNSLTHLTLFNQQGVQILEVPTERGMFNGILRCGDVIFAAYTEEPDALGVWDVSQGVPETDFALEESDVPQFPARFLQDGWVVGANGDAFLLDETGKRMDFAFSSGGDVICAAALGDEAVFRTGTESAVKYSRSGEILSKYAVPEGELLSLCVYEGKFLCLIKSGNSLLLADLEQYLIRDPESSEPPEESEPPSESEPDPPSGSSQIESAFPIDRENHFLILPHPMDFDQLMDGIFYPYSCEISMYHPNGSSFTSGMVATGCTLVLDLEGTQVDRLQIILLGDLDFSGTLTDEDENLLYGAVAGERVLDDLLFFAADFNGDGVLSTVDLLLFKKARVLSGQ